jgi:hypothetical protein
MADLEEATKATLPFSGGGTVDVTNPMALITTAVGLILGFALFSMASDIGAQIASRINAALASLTGTQVGGQGDDGIEVL